MDENTEWSVVVDASWVTSYLMPDEQELNIDVAFRGYRKGTLHLISSELLMFEVLNSLKTAIIRKRLEAKEANLLAEAFLRLKIETKQVDYLSCWELAVEKQLTIYDASYLHLAQHLQLPLFTRDEDMKKAAESLGLPRFAASKWLEQAKEVHDGS